MSRDFQKAPQPPTCVSTFILFYLSFTSLTVIDISIASFEKRLVIIDLQGETFVVVPTYPTQNTFYSKRTHSAHETFVVVPLVLASWCAGAGVRVRCVTRVSRHAALYEGRKSIRCALIESA